jgi:CBS domain-containing protein
VLRLKDIMTTEITTATPNMNLREAIDLLSTKHISGVPVVDRGRVVGVLSSTDLLSFVATLDDAQPTLAFRTGRRPLEEVTVAEMMTREVQSLGPDCSVELAASFMRRSQIHRVLVMHDQVLVGIVTTTDLAAAIADHKIRSRTYVLAETTSQTC